MPQHVPAEDSGPRKNAAKPDPAKTPGTPKKSADRDEDAAMQEWRAFAEFQFLDG